MCPILQTLLDDHIVYGSISKAAISENESWKSDGIDCCDVVVVHSDTSEIAVADDQTSDIWIKHLLARESSEETCHQRWFLSSK
jgi:hypothetical protein